MERRPRPTDANYHRHHHYHLLLLLFTLFLLILLLRSHPPAPTAAAVASPPPPPRYDLEAGSPTRARTIMEGVVGAHPKRSDLWTLFVDKEAKAAHVGAARSLLRRVTCMSWKAHTMK